MSRKALANLSGRSFLSTGEYRWRNGASFRQKFAPIFAEELDEIQARLGHAPTAAEIIDDARSSRSRIHDAFEWDDEVAAEKFRRAQASAAVSALTTKIVFQENGKAMETWMPARIVVRDGSCFQGGRHERLSDVMADPEKRRRALENVANRLLAMQQRHSWLTEFSGVFREARNVIRKKVPSVAHRLTPI